MRRTRSSALVAAAGALCLVASACGSPDLTPTGAAATSTSFTTTTLPGPDDAEATTTTSSSTTVPATTTTTEQPSSTSEPDPGLTDDVIRIAVIADVTSGDIGDQVFLPAWHGIDAWATFVNQFGGLAGRTVEVEFIDSAVVLHAEAIETVCTGDFFAVVGSQAIFDGDGAERLEECGIPDFPAVAYSQERRASEVTYLPNPLLNDIVQVGPLGWLAERSPQAAEAASTFFTGIGTFDVEVDRLVEAALSVGYEFVFDPTIEPGEDLIPIAQTMAEVEVRAVQWLGTTQRLVDLLTAIREVEVPVEFVHCERLCFADALAAGGDAAVGVTTWLPHVPLTETEENAELTAYAFSLNVSAGDDEVREPHPAGVASWAAGRLFETAVRLAIGETTVTENPDRLTREAVLAAAGQINDFTANELYAEPSNPARGIPTPCFVLVRFDGARWQRLHPAEPGTADCTATNLLLLTETGELGVDGPG